MKICYFVVFFVLFSQTITFKLKKSKAIKMPSKQKCDKIKCPPIDDPVCVKIKNKHMKDVYVIAINKCEIKYASCHKDINAAIVPMVNCRHDIENNQNTTSRRNKRNVNDKHKPVKGQVVDNVSAELISFTGQSKSDESKDRELITGQLDHNIKENQEIFTGQSDHNIKEDQEVFTGQSDHNIKENQEIFTGQSDHNIKEDQEVFTGQSDHNIKENQEVFTGQSDHNIKEDQEVFTGQSDHNIKENQEVFTGQSDHNIKENQEVFTGQSDHNIKEDQEVFTGQSDHNTKEDQALFTGQSDHNTKEDQALFTGQSDHEKKDHDLLNNEAISADNVKPVTSEDQNHSEEDANNSGDSGKLKKKTVLNNVEDKTQSDIEENEVPEPLVDNVGADYEQHDEEVDLDDNNKACPSVCPARDVMVCAKCKHNIHRTFLSLCHLRMFACKHGKEKLELVQRKPCVQSAPFITEYKETKGRIPGSGEVDEVHKFIFCRDKKLLNKDDPRCKFVETDE